MSHRTISLVTSVALAALLAGCSGGSSSGGGTTVVFQTGGGSLTTGTGTITVVVTDACSGEALSGALVWIDSDTANTETTNSSGLATFTSVAGQAGDRLISAGKVGYSLASALTSATSVRLGLVQTDRDGASQVTTVSGTITFQGSQTSAVVGFLDVDDCEAGFQGDVVGNSGGTGSYTVEVATGRAFTLVVASYDSDGTITALTSDYFSALNSAVTGQNYTLPAAVSGAVLSAGSLSNVPTGHDLGEVSSVSAVRWGGFLLSTTDFATSGGTGSVVDFELPDSTLHSEIGLLSNTSIVGAKTTDTSTNQFSFTAESVNLNASAFGTVAMPTGSASLTVTGTDARPDVSFSSSLTGSTGFHEVTFTQTSSFDRKRCWVFFLSGSDSTFDVPAVPAALAQDALVDNLSYSVELTAYLTSVSDFDNFSLSSILESVSQSGFGDESSYTP